MKPFMYAWVNKDNTVFDFSQSSDWAQEKIDKLNELGRDSPDYGYKIIPMFPGQPNVVGNQPNHKLKFETLVEHCKRQDTQLVYYRLRENYFTQYSNDDVWHWSREGQNYLDSLTCPIVISPADLQHIVGGGTPDRNKWVSLERHNNLNEVFTSLKFKYDDARHETDLLLKHLGLDPEKVRSPDSEHIYLLNVLKHVQAEKDAVKLEKSQALAQLLSNVDKLLGWLESDGKGVVAFDVLKVIRDSVREVSDGS